VSTAASRHRLARIAPGLAALRRYRRSDLPHDLFAGLTVAAVAVPTGVAYARLAGLNPAAGLSASVLPLVAYAVFGTSRQLVVGPSAATTALVASAIGPLAGGDAALALSLSTTLAFLVGVLCVGASALRLGAIADFLSRPILVGFMHGVALSIVLGQMGALFGVASEAGGIIPRLLELVRTLHLTHGPTLAVGLGTFAVLALSPRVLPRVPAPLVAMVMAGAAVRALGLDRAGVATVGPVPAGFPALRLPAFPIDLLPTLLAEAGGIALVSFSNMMLAARAFAARNRYDVDADREAAALGAANVAAALSQGFVVSGTNSRTAVADAAGGRTQLTGLVSAAAVATVLLAFTAPLASVPIAAVAAVLVRAALALVDLPALTTIRRIDPSEFWLSIIATIGVVVVGAIGAILLVVVLALLRFIRLTARPAVALLGTVEGQPGFHGLESHPAARSRPGLALFRFDGPIVFFSAPYFKREALAAAARAGDGLRWFVIDMQPVSMVDATGVLAIRDVLHTLRTRHVVVGMAGREREWADRIAAGDACEALAGIRLFPTLRQAATAFREATDAT